MSKETFPSAKQSHKIFTVIIIDEHCDFTKQLNYQGEIKQILFEIKVVFFISSMRIF